MIHVRSKILLGFEVPSGEPFYLDLHHLVITGMTELSGKTTAIEALIQRSGLRALVFKTKRGEKGFERVGKPLPLYFKERSDWQYVSSLIEATLREKMKFERSWIIRACKGAKTLRGVYARVKEFLKKERLRALDRSIFTNLQAYLELVLPSIEQLEFTDKLEIGPGVNVMDLEDLYAKPEVQGLIIRSVMEYILEYERDIIVVVPECWKFLPQGRGSPVKIFFERFIREGAAVNNYLWLDSQDIAGVDKTPLRQVDNWILGRQKETHEVNRTIDAIPLPKSEKPKPLEIRRLKLGHFIAACGDAVKLVYALPAGVPEEIGRKVAIGEMTPKQVRDQFLLRLREENEEMYKTMYEKEREKVRKLESARDHFKEERDKETERAKQVEQKFQKEVKRLKSQLVDVTKGLNEATSELEKLRKFEALDKALTEIIEAKLPKAVIPEAPRGPPTELAIGVETKITEFNVTVRKETLEASQDEPQGQMLILASEGWFDEPRNTRDIRAELDRRFNSRPRPGTVENIVADLAGKQIFVREKASGKKGGRPTWMYCLRPEAKERIKVTET